jgi:hypothetical protein
MIGINLLDLLAKQLDMQHPVHLSVAYLYVSPVLVFVLLEVQYHAHLKPLVRLKLDFH